MLLARFAATIAMIFASSVPALAANLIRNGSFEKPVLPDGQLRRLSTGDKFYAWKVVGDPGTVDIITKDFTFEGQDFPAKYGHQWLDLTGNTDAATGVQQTVGTWPGASYQISFFIGSAYDPAGQLGTSSAVHVLVDGNEIAVLSATGKAGISQRWRKVSTEFVAQNAKTLIAFINGDPANDTDCGIDAVSVTRVTP